MRQVDIGSALNSQIEQGKKYFYQKEVASTLPSMSPGEWFSLNYQKKKWMAYGNPFAESVPSLWVLDGEFGSPEDYINNKILKALEKRKSLYKSEGKRLVFGQSDGLPGLIIDAYDKHILIQINTAGIDRYRDFIKNKIKENFPTHMVHLFDRQSYRQSESLPEFERDWNPDDLVEITDSALSYSLTMNKMQKLGFYFDHRDNRRKFEDYLRTSISCDNERALDLFCYLGAWGLQAIRAGSKHVDFVDQADLEVEVLKNFQQVSGKVTADFYRKDVFKFLDESQKNDKKWNIVICDPPAFCKSIKQKNQALSGYKKLYNKIFKVLSPNATLVAASCTKYINLEELTHVVEMQAKESGRRVTLRDIGIQAMDHPFSSLKDNANYIKYALYAVE